MASKSQIFVLSWLTASVVSLSCDSDVIQPPDPTEGHFPLQVGNQWTYALAGNESFKLSHEIVGTTRIDSHGYFVLRRQFGEDANSDSVFYRVESPGRIFTNHNGEDVLYIDFNLPVGDTWESFGAFIARIVRKGFTSSVPAGDFENSIEVFFDVPQVIDDENTRVFAKGIGLVEIRGQIGFIQLESAVVSGVAIP